MNQYSVPDWSLDQESQTLHDLLPTSTHQKTSTHENELVELLWKNGHVVMQSQNTWKPPSTVPEPRDDPTLGSPIGNSSNPIQEDGPLPWYQYHLDDSLGRDFSDLFCEIPEPDKDVSVGREKYVRFGAAEEDGNNFTMPPPKFGCAQQAPSLGDSGVINRLKDDLGSRSGRVGIGESSSVRTVGSSACGSNQADIRLIGTTVSSSSGRSGCSFGRTVGQRSGSNQNHKRKGRDGDDSECHSEEAEYESMHANMPAQLSVSTRKSRAAEVHNLSERRRRDRINEKMKALQELIPHCNKSDKASMLDEAIEYLKSLQLQLQIMWMGSGMAPMMFPGVQQYMSRVGIGMGHASSVPSMNNGIQMARAPPINHSTPSTSSANQMPLNPINFPRQMQTAHLPEASYAQYLGFPHMQLPPQAMNLYAYGSNMMVQQNRTAVATGSSSLMTAGIPSEKIQNGQSG